MKVVVEIPDKVWWVLAKNAEDQGLTVSDVIAHGIRSVMPKPAPVGEDVLRFVREGFEDSRIAEALGCSKWAVSKIRRDAGLDRSRVGRATGKAS